MSMNNPGTPQPDDRQPGPYWAPGLAGPEMYGQGPAAPGGPPPPQGPPVPGPHTPPPLPQFGGTPAAAPPGPAPTEGHNVVGFVALVLAVPGFILCCSPWATAWGGLVATVAFVLGLIGLFGGGPKWPAAAAMIVSVTGGFAGFIVRLALFGIAMLNVMDAPVLPADPSEGTAVYGDDGTAAG